ncbi:WD domain, G-beta repeat-containing protein [Cardiosporidium cionae]|uniref:WD domain, G-beta repeat-containing protein n=1 Tax=Cardiosporidium cionae TaxID=476202 RepID=A0ABQ7J9K7_9APIC|nr:WD domain, G-beta repeat-containing protein [Cardiosporidium cionae]|eukprot:KAF8820685.1 WD domain, G-beta repeat-containing protein [Cardiosporidium cionae]
MKHIVQKYVGHQQRLYAVRSAFGGPNESFVLCGCEDNQVYIWQRYRGSLLEIISGHTGTVNAVIWPCKTNFSLMISASDDHTLVLWHFDEHFKEDFPINAKTDKSSDAALENADAADIAVDSSHWIAL